MIPSGKKIAFLYGPLAYVDKQNNIWLNRSLGKVIDEFANRALSVKLVVGFLSTKQDYQDYCLQASNVDIYDIGLTRGALSTLKTFFSQNRDAHHLITKVVSDCDLVVVRGVLTPFLKLVHSLSNKFGFSCVHWIVGDVVSMGREKIGNSLLKGIPYFLFSHFWRRQVIHLHHRNKRSYLVCNGKHIEETYTNVRSKSVVSSTFNRFDINRIDQQYNDVRKSRKAGTHIKLVTVSFVRPEKGLDDLIRAFSMLETKFNVTLEIYGSYDESSEYFSKLNSLISFEGLEDKIAFKGSVGEAELQNALSEASIFVFASLSEGTPRVIHEAALYRLPIATTNVGGLSDYLKERESVLFSPPRDPFSLSKNISYLLNNIDQAKELGEQAYIAARQHTVETLVSDLGLSEEGESNYE